MRLPPVVAGLVLALNLGLASSLVLASPGGLAPVTELPEQADIDGGGPVQACGWPTAVSDDGCTGTLVHPRS